MEVAVDLVDNESAFEISPPLVIHVIYSLLDDSGGIMNSFIWVYLF